MPRRQCLFAAAEPVGLVVHDEIAPVRHRTHPQHRVDAAAQVAAQGSGCEIGERVGIRGQQAGRAVLAPQRHQVAEQHLAAHGSSPPASGSSKSSSGSRSDRGRSRKAAPSANGPIGVASDASKPEQSAPRHPSPARTAPPARPPPRVPHRRRRDRRAPRARCARACRTPRRPAARPTTTGSRAARRRPSAPEHATSSRSDSSSFCATSGSLPMPSSWAADVKAL